MIVLITLDEAYKLYNKRRNSGFLSIRPREAMTFEDYINREKSVIYMNLHWDIQHYYKDRTLYDMKDFKIV